VSHLHYDQQYLDAGGWDWPKLLVLVLVLVFFAPMLVLGGIGLVVWRFLGLRRRWIVLALALSLAPASAAAYAWQANPLELFFQAHLSVLMAASLWLIGQADAIPPP
jgi:hypothetical protein